MAALDVLPDELEHFLSVIGATPNLRVLDGDDERAVPHATGRTIPAPDNSVPAPDSVHDSEPVDVCIPAIEHINDQTYVAVQDLCAAQDAANDREEFTDVLYDNTDPRVDPLRASLPVLFLAVLLGILRKYRDGAIRLWAGRPDHSNLEQKIDDYDWMCLKNEIPAAMPFSKGYEARCTSFVDANLHHDYTTGRSVTGVIHLLNLTPIEWFTKRQNSVETARYGSEFAAARTATEQLMDLRYTLRMFSAPLDGPAYLFGDNESVVTQSTIPHSMLNKRHNALSSYHRVREVVASKMMDFIHVDGKQNIADCLSKLQPHLIAWPLIKPFLFWKGETQFTSMD
jgi:hypothetical protein